MCTPLAQYIDPRLSLRPWSSGGTLSERTSAESNLHTFLSRETYLLLAVATFVVNLPIQRLSVPFLAALMRLFGKHLFTVCIQLFLSCSRGFMGSPVHLSFCSMSLMWLDEISKLDSWERIQKNRFSLGTTSKSSARSDRRKKYVQLLVTAVERENSLKPFLGVLLKFPFTAKTEGAVAERCSRKHARCSAVAGDGWQGLKNFPVRIWSSQHMLAQCQRHLLLL